LIIEQERLEQWIAEGKHGTMEWLARDPARRCDPEKVLPGCKSVVVLTMGYHTKSTDEDRRDAEPSGKISRYARGRDYHRVFEKALRKLARWIDDQDEEFRTRPYVDYGPVMERAWAERAGLGFTGKHTLLIDPARGSWFFLGVLLTTAELPTTSPPSLPMGCGDCRRCIDVCPTDAITEPWKLDARRCISYLTIEHDGPIPEGLAEKLEGWAFGCDLCQEVCPYNRKRATPRDDEPFAPRMAPAEWSLVEMLKLDDESLAHGFPGSPLKRAGADKLKRNAEALLKVYNRRDKQ